MKHGIITQKTTTLTYTPELAYEFVGHAAFTFSVVVDSGTIAVAHVPAGQTLSAHHWMNIPVVKWLAEKDDKLYLRSQYPGAVLILNGVER